jgi:hypothetical protein
MSLLVVVEIVTKPGDGADKGEGDAWCPVEAAFFFICAGIAWRRFSTGLAVASRGLGVCISSSHDGR